jgi:acetyl esterase/lipase
VHHGGSIRDRRARRARRALGRTTLGASALVAVVLLAGCEGYTVQRVNEVRAEAGVGTLATSPVARDAARARSASMCAAGATSPSPDPDEAYDQETAAAVHELVGSAPLDPTRTEGATRNGVASNQIWAAWRDDPALVDPRWDEIGVGEAECPDGRLYMTAVLRDAPTVPATGRYASGQHSDAQLQVVNGLRYGQAIGYQGTTEDLRLDVYRPPGTVPGGRPTIVLIHGGAFAGGDRSSNAGVARSWARKGYVAVSISYRLDPRLAMSPRPPGVTQLGAAANAIDDGMESIRWLKANASTYGIDPTRIATVGYSAGGAISLGIAAMADLTPGGPLAAYSPSVAAAVSTGAQLTPGIDAGAVTFQPTDAPVLMFHHETDAASGTAEYAMRTCSAIRAGGSTCDFVLQPGEGHTTDLDPDRSWWPTELGPFLWTQLRLASAG